MTNRMIGSAARRRAAIAALASLLLGGCTTTGRVEVSSSPAGARILIDGVDSGQQTPNSVVLSTSKSEYTLTVDKPGYNAVSRRVRFATDLDVIDADEAVSSVLCAPFCCGLPLLRLLHPVDVESRFVPSRFDAQLEVAGQGARLSVRPQPFEAYLDGHLVALLEGDYLVTTPGDHELEIRSTGCRPYTRSIHVDECVYQPLQIELSVEGQGLLVTGAPLGAKVYLDDQFQGTLGEEARRVRAEPGPHMLRLEQDGWRPWQDVVQVAADQYQEVGIYLALEGQGLRVRKPEGLPVKTPQIQILVDGTLRGSAFDQPMRLEPGDYAVEVVVSGRMPRQVRVHVTKDSWIDLEPGDRIPRGAPGPQILVDTFGIRVVAPEWLEDADPEDVQILVDGSLRGHLFDQIIVLDSVGDRNVEVRVKGFKPWTQAVHVSRGQILEVRPDLKKE